MNSNDDMVAYIQTIVTMMMVEMTTMLAEMTMMIDKCEVSDWLTAVGDL
jgi:hypothetical protein